jgi:hypothetical protein
MIHVFVLHDAFSFCCDSLPRPLLIYDSFNSNLILCLCFTLKYSPIYLGFVFCFRSGKDFSSVVMFSSIVGTDYACQRYRLTTLPNCFHLPSRHRYKLFSSTRIRLPLRSLQLDSLIARNQIDLNFSPIHPLTFRFFRFPLLHLQRTNY